MRAVIRLNFTALLMNFGFFCTGRTIICSANEEEEEEELGFNLFEGEWSIPSKG